MDDVKEEIQNNDTLLTLWAKNCVIIFLFVIPLIFIIWRQKFVETSNLYFYILFGLYIPLQFLLLKFFSCIISTVIIITNIIFWILISFFNYLFQYYRDFIIYPDSFLKPFDYVSSIIISITAIIIYYFLSYKFFDRLENNEIRYKVNIENLKLKTANLNNKAIDTRNKIVGHKILIKKFNMLNNISSSFLEANNTPKIIKILLEKINEIFKPDNYFLIINENSYLNIENDIYIDFKPIDKNIVNTLIKPFDKKFSPLFIENIEKDVLLNSISAKSKYSSIIVVPLLHMNHLIGNIAVFYTKKYSVTSHHLRLLNYISNIFSVSLCSSFLYEETEKQAQKDGLTGLYKRWYFEEELTKELNIAKRYNSDLSVIMVDIDHFKKINDSYGHPVGDTILAKTGELFLNSITKPMEIASRWGGEEFIILLPGKNKNEAFNLAENIRIDFAEKLNITEIKESITASFGVAAFPEDGIFHYDLIMAADKAMYKSKETGRNKVSCC